MGMMQMFRRLQHEIFPPVSTFPPDVDPSGEELSAPARLAIERYAEEAAARASEEATAMVRRAQQEAAVTAAHLVQAGEQILETQEIARRNADAGGRNVLGYANAVGQSGVYTMNDPRRWRDASDPRTRPFRPVTTDMLRQLAQNYDILAGCIAYLKTEVIKTPLNFTPVDDDDDSQVTKRQVKVARDFFETTGGLGSVGKTRLQFEGEWLDDLLVIGCAALYMNYETRGALIDKNPDSVIAIDASTIRPLITPFGFAPGENEAAYEQVVQGRRVATFERSELMYDGLPIFAQTTTPYSISAVELLAMICLTALKTDEWNRTWLTDGNVPDYLVQVPKEWTPQQIQEYSDYFDLLLAGNSRNRHQAKIVPEGTHGSAQSRKEADFATFETWLRDRAFFVMGMHPAAGGFSSETFKYAQEGAMDATRGGRVAQLLMYRNVKYTDICRLKGWDKVRVSDPVTDTEDLKSKADRLKIQISSGLLTINEGRKEMGIDPSAEAGADVLFIEQTLVTVESLVAPPEPAPAPAPTDAPLGTVTEENSEPADDDERPVAENPTEENDVAQAETEARIDAELAITRGQHQYSCLMAPLSSTAAATSMDWAKDNFQPEQLTKDGIENSPHVTVFYGFHSEQPKNAVNVYDQWCDENDKTSLTATVGNFMLFRKRAAEDWDVLVYKIDSPDLHSLNAAMAQLPNSNEYPEYKPHMTVAYLVVGEADIWEGKAGPLTGETVTFERLLFSSKNGTEHWIDNDSDHTYTEEVGRALKQWERKATNRLERGKSAACRFDSDVIDATTALQVLAGLEKCVLKSDVRRVFGEVIRVVDANGMHHADDGKFGTGSGSGTAQAATPKLSAKAQRAKDNHKLIDKTVQRYAEEHNEPRFADAVGGESYADSEPVDVAIKEGDVVKHGIEMKTMVSNKNNKITMKRSAMEKKKAWQEANNAPFHTVVLDDHEVFEAHGSTGDLRPNSAAYTAKHNESKRAYYYKRGGGSFRVGSMHKCKDLAEVKSLMNMSDDELPTAAKPSKSWTELQGKAGARN